MDWNTYQQKRNEQYDQLENERYIEKTNIECPKCGKNLYRKADIVIMTNPPKYYYNCSCGWTGVGY